MAIRYMITRFHQDENHPDHRKIIKQVDTVDEAQEWCRREDTHGDGWFDGYEWYEDGSNA